MLAGRVTTRGRRAYVLPYYTRDGADTEYLISNPNRQVVRAALMIFGKNCRVTRSVDFKLKPDCTRSFRLRVIVPDLAGFCLVVADGELASHVLYLRKEDLTVAGAAQAGRDQLVESSVQEASRTYVFGYRAVAPGRDTLSGTVFVSNPHQGSLSGHVVFYDQNCEPALKRRIAVGSGCTEEYAFPKDRLGYGRIQISQQALINVLHFSKGGGLVAAELVEERQRVDAPPEPPPPRARILFDDTHSCRPGIVGDWTAYEAALVVAGYTVTHHTAPALTPSALQACDVFVIAMAMSSYTDAEKTAITDFVNAGGGLLIGQDFGGGMWSVHMREILNLFGTSDENNTVTDPNHHCDPSDPSSGVLFDAQRNFLAHPILSGVNAFCVNAVATLSGGPEWTTVVETDDDAVPARRPVVIVRPFGAGRVLAFGDTNAWSNQTIGDHHNQAFGVRCAEWLLFRF